MAEQRARENQYAYKALSNLVTQADRSLMNRIGKNESTGEVQSLVGKLDHIRMGDRFQQARPPQVEDYLNKKQKKRKQDALLTSQTNGIAPTNGGHDGLVLARFKANRSMGSAYIGNSDTNDLNYQPKTRATQQIYEMILNIVQSVLGGQTHDVVNDASDQLLDILKDGGRKDSERKRAVVDLLGSTVTDELYYTLNALSKKLTDYIDPATVQGKSNAAMKQNMKAEDTEVAVVFDEDEEMDQDEDDEDEDGNEGKFGIVREDNEASGSEDEQKDILHPNNNEHGARDNVTDHVYLGNNVKLNASVAVNGTKTNSHVYYEGKEEFQSMHKLTIDPFSIDAHWVQREVGKFNDDPISAQQVAIKVLDIIDTARDERDLETKLILLLSPMQFAIIKTIRENRFAILYCTKLASAETDAQKLEIKNYLKKTDDLVYLFNILFPDESIPINATDSNNIYGNSPQNIHSEGTSSNNLTHDSISIKSPSANKVLDLDKLKLDASSENSLERTIRLPVGTKKNQFDNYEEVVVPELTPKPFEPNERLVPVSELPDYAQRAFTGLTSLNRIQSRLYPYAMGCDGNMLLCAPTGAGKTNVAMMAILREIGKHVLFSPPQSNSTSELQLDLDAFKIVYIAPMKSLVAEMVGNFTNRLKPYGIVVSELTGDSQLSRDQLANTQVIVCTPEKWDIVTRKGADRNLLKTIKLIIIDEVHLLHDERGPVLEAIVARTLRSSEMTQEPVRLVGLSATLPNYLDVARFMRVDLERGLFFFDNRFRPVPLRQTFVGVTEKKAYKRQDAMNKIVYQKVIDYAGREQLLIFVHSRKDTAKTARFLKDMCLENNTMGKLMKEDSASHEIIRTEVERTKNKDLKDILSFGIGIHHAGMSRVDRTLVEDLFSAGHLQVLVSTATLAWGVNLPAHTVIIKGTMVYNPEYGRWSDLSHMDVLQMFGRAGRPQFDNLGEAILITSHQSLHTYLSVLNQQSNVESQLINRLPDTINAEIVLGTITNINEAVTWLGYTYYYVRMTQSPELYGVIDSINPIQEQSTQMEGEEGVVLGEDGNTELYNQFKRNLAHTCALVLEKSGLINYDRRSGEVKSTELGRIGSHYYISYKSISKYNTFLKPTMSDIDLLRLFSMSAEFEHISVKPEEKIELAKLHERVPIPIKENIDDPLAKVSVLLQAHVSQLQLEGFALMSDMSFITQSASRLLRGIYEIVLHKKWAYLAQKCLDYCKMIDHKMWLSMTPLRQFKKLPMDIIKHIEKKDMEWDRFYDLTPVAIGEFVRHPKLGKVLHKFIHAIPKLAFTVNVQPITSNTLRFVVTITPDFLWDNNYHGNSEPFYIHIQDVDGEMLLHSEFFLLKQRYAQEPHTVSFFINLDGPLPPHLFVRVISDRWIASETYLPVSLQRLILPAKNDAFTEVLDLQPVVVSQTPLSSIYKPLEIESNLNSIQSQVYSAITEDTSSNILICAPLGSGQLQLVELSFLNLVLNEQQNVYKMVYIASNDELAHIRYTDWTCKFNSEHNKLCNVHLLTGITATDLKKLSSGGIIISTPSHWDALSRRWTQRSSVSSVDLFVVDGLQFLSSQTGPIVEVITSRMRYIANQAINNHIEDDSMLGQRTCRIIGLSTPLANAKDVASWLGASSKTTFNFSPMSRPVPLDLHIKSFNINHAGTRHSAMAKDVYLSINRHASNNIKEQSVIIFTTTRAQCLSTALDLIRRTLDTTVNCDDEPASPYFTGSKSDLIEMKQKLHDPMLYHLAEHGIGVIHEGIKNKADETTIYSLFNSKIIQILIISHAKLWTLNANAHLSIIMDTQYYDGKEHRYLDYTMVDITYMVGSANYSGARTISKEPSHNQEQPKCIILCESTKKSFLLKFITESFPLESHLDQFLHDHFNAEIVSKIIENKQEAVDYLTWTFYYRRLSKNANYYNLQGLSRSEISEHLSELVENVLTDLEQSHVISIEEDTDLQPLNLGMISAFYYLDYTTIELFNMSLTERVQLPGLLEVISSSSEFSLLPIRNDEEKLLELLSMKLPIKLSSAKYNDPQTKVNLLLQAHFSRLSLPSELFNDLCFVLEHVHPLIQACIDVLSSNGWLRPALVAMELAQMVTQAVWDIDSQLRQIPHFTPNIIRRFSDEMNIKSVIDFINLEDDQRTAICGELGERMLEVAQFCNSYPSVEIEYIVLTPDHEIVAGEQIAIKITLSREDEEYTAEQYPVHAPFFGTNKEENWWVVIGDDKKNILSAIKYLSIGITKTITLSLQAPPHEGSYPYKLFLMSDSYIGTDQEQIITLNVLPQSMTTDNDDDNDDSQVRESIMNDSNLE